MTPVVASVLAAIHLTGPGAARPGNPPAATAQTTSRLTFDIPASAGDVAVNRLALQAGVSVAVEMDLSGRRSVALRGRYGLDEAFERLLHPMGARAVRLGPGVYRVEARPARPVSPRPVPARPVAPPAPAEPTLLEEVVVTAPVGRGGLDGVNGRGLLEPTAVDRRPGVVSSAVVADLSASVESTRQGAGRNKLFVRGVADSALSGPLQATVGQYLGDFRLNYGSPDPDLAVVDMERIEVFEGPQGARFGAGSIGGVVRLHPAAPDPDDRFGTASAAVSAPRGGAPGAEATLVLNRPLDSRTAIRAAGWSSRTGGVLANPVRGEDHADHIDALGGRLAVRRVGTRWTVDGLGLLQSIRAGDSPLVRDPRRLESDRPFAEPYESALALAGFAANARFDAVRVTVATTVSRQTLDERFDASVAEANRPELVDRRQAVTAGSGELRVSTDPGARWSVNGGVSAAVARTTVDRTRTAPGRPDEVIQRVGLDRAFAEVAAFGDVVWRPDGPLAFSFGGRLSAVRLDVAIDADGVDGDRIPPSVDVRATPALGLRWRRGRVALFGRFEQAVRPGDVSEVRGFGDAYRSDRVSLTEAGGAVDGGAAWSVEASVGLIGWDDIQSDLIATSGDLVTTNIGDGRIAFVQLRGRWRPTDRLSLEGGAFLNRSRIEVEGLGVIGVTGGDIPNVAPAGLRLSVDHGPFALAGGDLSWSADLRYVGPSRPGLGPGLDRTQGDYVLAELQGRFGDARRAVVLSVSNPFDDRAARFGVGSPFRLTESYVAPVRPLTIRLGFESRF